MKCFVTGTDTGVGKTHVTAALVERLRAGGRRAEAIKPIETGWDPENSDAARLARASNQPLSETIWRWFTAARSARAAARLEGVEIDPVRLTEWCRARTADPLLIEGAGGWRVPISDRFDMRELAVATSDAVMVVARAGLGTVNHTLLTVEAVEQRAALFGVVLSRRPTDELEFARENADELAYQSGLRIALFPDDAAEIVAWFDGGFEEQPTHRTPPIKVRA
jgi:dethiobiotin synthetase